MHVSDSILKILGKWSDFLRDVNMVRKNRPNGNRTRNSAVDPVDLLAVVDPEPRELQKNELSTSNDNVVTLM